MLHFNKSTLIGILSGSVLLVLVAAPGTALAHERRTIGGGQYDVVVGWDVEPAYAGMKNAASIRITQAGTTTPVTGADKSLKLAIRQGASTQAFPLKAAFGQDGYYTAEILPTRVGDYQWIFTGDIGGNAVNETFDTADGKFNAVQASTAIQFPVQLGDPTQAASAVQAAQSDAQSARTLALVAIVIGIVGILVGLGAWLMRPRSATTQPAATSGRPASECEPGMRGSKLWAALAVTLYLGCAPATAWAHANLDRGDPSPGSQLDQPPKQLQLDFSEAVDGSFSRVQLLNPKGDSVDRGDSRVAPNDPLSLVVSLPDQLPDGVYTVAWRTLSAVDGHTVNGAYPLIVGPMPAEGVPVTASAGSSEATFDTETAAARWWFSLAGSAVFGVLLSWHLVLRPLFGRSNPAALPMAAQRARKVALISCVVLLVGTLYMALAQAAAAGDVPIWGVFGQPLVDLLSRGRFATLWWARLALVLVALGMIAWRGVRRWPGQVALVASGLALLTSSFTSHGAALLSGAYLGIAVDWLHFLGVAAWLGGLLSLAFVLPVVVQASQATGDRVLARAVARFSKLALVAVALIIASGTFQLWLEVGSWDGLVQTAYGLTVMTKIGLLGLMLVLAAFNLLVARPGLAKMAASGSAAAASGLARRFSLSVRLEVLLGVIVLLAAAILTSLSPARDQIAREASGDITGPVDRSVNSSGVDARIQITPAVLGINRLAVQLPNTDPSVVERVQLTLTYLDSELGSQPVVLTESTTAPDTWETTSPLLSQAGNWQAEMLVRRTGQDDARTALRFQVASPGGSTQTPSTSSSAYPLLPSPMISLAYLLIALGVVVAVVAIVRSLRGPRRRRALQRQAAVVGAGIVLLACGGYVYAAENRNGVPLDVANIRDPIPPDDRSLAIGKDVYTTYCETCHGETGRGDGPSGLRLVPRPADLRIHTAPGVHTDGELYYWVAYGFPGTAMPAWKQNGLTDEQIWSAINYARATFGNSGGP